MRARRLTGARQAYAWGSTTAIPALLGEQPGTEPVAEVWFGAHPAAPSTLADGTALADRIAEDPAALLGQDVVAALGPRLPYLVKLIAPGAPLSLQVHPSIEQARTGYAREERLGVPRTAPHRVYVDENHKPEMVYALETFEAIAGFRTPRRALEVLRGLDAALARRLHAVLSADRTADGIRAAFTCLLDPPTRPDAAAIAEVVTACADRLARGVSPSARADRVVGLLAEAFPGDPGAVASLLMNPVTLRPGEVLFTPAGGVHCYLSGLGVEVMASSDNVLRAGLTTKHVDVEGVLATVDWVAAPPVRIGPEHVDDRVEVYYAPVDDFEMALTQARGDAPVRLPGRGPRVLLAIEGRPCVAHGEDDRLALGPGEAAFVPASAEPVVVTGQGRLVQVTVP